MTGVRLPLKLGAKWDTHFTASRKNPDRDSTIDATSVVTGYEEVSFRFGLTYDAFKIETNESVAAAGGGPSATLKVISVVRARGEPICEAGHGEPDQ